MNLYSDKWEESRNGFLHLETDFLQSLICSGCWEESPVRHVNIQTQESSPESDIKKKLLILKLLILTMYLSLKGSCSVCGFIESSLFHQCTYLYILHVNPSSVHILILL